MKSTYLNELDVRNLLVVSVSLRSEEQLLYETVQGLAIPKQRSNNVFSNASLG
jgi:hypothetical protein